jgi:DNA end-binding protein Ku
VPSAIWTGSISFGLVTVPVRLVSATKSLDVRFNQLDADTGSRIRYRRVSEATGEEIPQDKIVRGYEVEPGRYVVLEADELEALQPKKSRQIEIEDFVDLAEIDPIFF